MERNNITSYLGVAILIITSVISGCTSNPPNPSLTTVFKLTTNGVTNQWNGSLFDNTTEGAKIEHTAQITCVPEGYKLSAFRNSDSVSCTFKILTSNNNLIPGTYQSLGLGNGCSFYNTVEIVVPNQNTRALSEPLQGDTFTVIVTQVSNGYASGNFSGTVRNHVPSVPNPPISIYGEFENVKYIQ